VAVGERWLTRQDTITQVDGTPALEPVPAALRVKAVICEESVQAACGVSRCPSVKMENESYVIEIINNVSVHELYTYRGEIKEVIDGDTLWINLDLGFNTWTLQKVRFRGINTARMGTEIGIKAKKFIERKLKPCEFIIVKTYYRDKYNRYLADIFYNRNEIDPFKVAEKGIFLNQELLDAGLDVKYRYAN
jgi:micrococcal nuclease